MCILHCLRYLTMEFVVTRMVEDLVMGPVTRFLLGDEGGDEGGGEGGAGRREEDGGSA